MVLFFFFLDSIQLQKKQWSDYLTKEQARKVSVLGSDNCIYLISPFLN